MVEKVIVIGGGPAGLAAAIYLGRAGLSPVVFSGDLPGGQPILTSYVENFPGHEKISGPELAEKIRRQAKSFGAKITDKLVIRVDFSQKPFKIFTTDQTYLAQAVLIATGAKPVWLGLPSEKRFIGRGVSTCANCDGFFYKDKVVAVVGGGDTALEEALSLTQFAKKVYIIHRRHQFRATEIMQKRALNHPKIKIIWDSQVVEVLGKDKVEAVKLKTTENFSPVNKSQQKSSQNKPNNQILKIDGLFVAIGHRPATEIFKNQIKMDEKGYILTKNYLTSVDGVFAAGDCVDSVYRQLATAVGAGVAAALEIKRWLEKKSD
ncbi:MAG: thioredoxin-disulfide reductase [Microgenomates group bacterium]|nr:thioredoxin-disulfide reductase [Microgenomates group bacterium]